MDTYKIDKYTNKLINKLDNKDIYYRKLYDLHGGIIPNFTKYIDTVVNSDYLDNIINNKVSFIDNKKEYYKIIFETDTCVTVDDPDIPFDVDYIDENFGYKCLNKTKPSELYLIKRKISGQLTDTFIRDIIDDKTYEEMIISFYGILNTLVQQYVNVYNDNNIHTQITNNDVYFVYKGGNINRMFNKKMFDLFDQIIDHKVDIFKLNNALKLFSQEDKRSDFDCYVYINLNLPTYDLIANQIQKVLAVGLEYIKCNFDKLFENYRSDGKFDAKQLFSFLFNNEDFKSQLNEMNTELLSVQTRNYLISKDQILLKDSKEIKNKIVHTKKDKKDKMDYIESSTMLYPEYLSTLCKNDAFIVRAENLSLYSFGNKMNFDIIRLKINNLVKIKLNDKKVPINCAYELIDIVVSKKNNDHNKFIFEQLKKNNENKTHIFKYNYNDKYVDLRVPSIYYIIYDLYGILFRLNQFIWNEKKYEKRIRRLFNLLLYKSIEKGQINKFLEDSLNFTKFITNILSLLNNKTNDIYKFIDMLIQINPQNNDIELIDDNNYYKMFILYIIKYIYILNKLNNIRYSSVSIKCPNEFLNKENIIYTNYKLNSRVVDYKHAINITKPLQYFIDNIDSEYKKFNNFINYMQIIVVDINIILNVLTEYNYDLKYYINYDNISKIL